VTRDDDDDDDDDDNNNNNNNNNVGEHWEDGLGTEIATFDYL
jgi:hypothetical protein